jgi:hypothetical protein
MLELLLRLRQACCHTALVRKAVEALEKSTGTDPTTVAAAIAAALSPEQMERVMGALAGAGDEPCCICLDVVREATVTPCGHVFCRACIQQHLSKPGKSWCVPSPSYMVADGGTHSPLCRRPTAAHELIDASALMPAEAAEERPVQARVGARTWCTPG